MDANLRFSHDDVLTFYDGLVNDRQGDNKSQPGDDIADAILTLAIVIRALGRDLRDALNNPEK